MKLSKSLRIPFFYFPKDYCLLLAYELLYLWNALGACLKHCHASILVGKTRFHKYNTMPDLFGMLLSFISYFLSLRASCTSFWGVLKKPILSDWDPDWKIVKWFGQKLKNCHVHTQHYRIG